MPVAKIWNGTEWVVAIVGAKGEKGDPGDISGTLGSIPDVDLDDLEDGQILVYDASGEEAFWRNQTLEIDGGAPDTVYS
jgi:flagellar basal body rod protein FlgF